ncbi:MAG: SDR family NAD(P)-dependent oxidoreductase, partial [bacterium]|nr:SDR family NAD(P)-dependent oxidoreductase [bacterium]
MQQADPCFWQEHHFGLPQPRWDRLHGRAFWITGAGTGYGRAIALALAAAGAQVFLTGRRKEKLQETLDEGVAFGINVDLCIPVVADISVESDLVHAVEVISQHVSQLHGLVNSAALPQPGVDLYPLADLSLAAWSGLFTTNVTAQWLTSRAVLPVMANGDTIRIIFMSSEAGWAATPGFGPYNV